MINPVLCLQAFTDAAREAPEAQLVAREEDVVSMPLPQNGWFSKAPSLFSNPSLEELEEKQRLENQNRCTWKAFLRAVKEVYSKDRVKRDLPSICSTYGLGKLEDLKKGPLLSSYVDRIHAGFQPITIDDFGDFKDFSCKQVREKMGQFNSSPYKPKNKPGLTVKEVFIPNPHLNNERILFLSEKARTLENLPGYYELLAKKFVTQAPKKGSVHAAPNNENYQVVDVTGSDGLRAYAFAPMGVDSQLPNIVAFRPSQRTIPEEAVETWLEDLGTHIGQNGYNASKEALTTLTNESFNQDRLKVGVGFSLGGAHLQYYLADHWQEFDEAYFFNDPSIDPETVAKFAHTINHIQPSFNTRKLTLHVYRTVQVLEDGTKLPDVVHCAGGRHLGWGINNPDVVETIVHEIQYKAPKADGLVKRHGKLFLGGEQDVPEHNIVDFRGKEVHAQLDNTQRGPDIYWYEKMRAFWGVHILYHLLNGVWKCIKGICRCVDSCLSRF
jgi:hypothetical protein